MLDDDDVTTNETMTGEQLMMLLATTDDVNTDDVIITGMTAAVDYDVKDDIRTTTDEDMLLQLQQLAPTTTMTRVDASMNIHVNKIKNSKQSTLS
eukprot:3669616-Ditylum_brightwellii.AAC.1